MQARGRTSVRRRRHEGGDDQSSALTSKMIKVLHLLQWQQTLHLLLESIGEFLYLDDPHWYDGDGTHH